MEYAQVLTVSTEWLISNTVSVASAFLILWVGWWLSKFLSNHVATLLPRTRRIDNTITPLVSQLVRYGVLIVTFIAVLGQFGVQTASILAVLGAAGLAIALALQGTLSNIAAGVMLIWLRPFNAGEYIDAEGIAGTVVEIGLFGTRMRTFDGIYIYVPNSKLWDARITNFTRETTRMVEIKVGIAYTADIAKARAVMLEIAKDERVLAEPAPSVFVSNLGESSVEMAMRVWVNGPNWWSTKIDFMEKVKTRFDQNGIEIPYNKLDINILRRTPAH